MGLALACACVATACSGLPSEVEELVFEQGRFADPILLPVPKESDRTRFERLKTKPELFPGPCLSESGKVDPETLRFLKAHELVEVERVKASFIASTCEGTWVFYTDRLRPLLLERKGMFVSVGAQGLPIASRELADITYTNRYERQLFGTAVDTLSMTFTYRLRPSFDGVRAEEPEREGKATVYLDPSDGAWKLDELTLGDRGATEFELTAPQDVDLGPVREMKSRGPLG